MKLKFNFSHTPVLLQEVINLLVVEPGKFYIDATVGGGGHAIEICKKGGRVLGIDCDKEAIKAAGKNLKKFCPETRFKLVKGNFSDLKKIFIRYGKEKPAGILFDLGASSYQLTSQNRGFSFQGNEALDMRMDLGLKINAKDLINKLSKEELYEILAKFGGEERALPIAEAIVQSRREQPIETTEQLVDIILKIKKPGGKIHPATKTFQALRIAVNKEVENLKTALPQAVTILKRGGRLAVISFHEGEDRIVKSFFRKMRTEERVIILTKKPITPSFKQVSENRRSRSAKLRGVIKK